MFKTEEIKMFFLQEAMGQKFEKERKLFPVSHLSRILRKMDICLCENKGADQLRSKLLACFCDCTGRFVSGLVGNPEDRFSRVAAHLISPEFSFTKKVVQYLRSQTNFALSGSSRLISHSLNAG